MDSISSSPENFPRGCLRYLIPLFNGKNRTICPAPSVVRMANERVAVKAFGKCKRCYIDVSAWSSLRIVWEVLFGHFPPNALLPYLSYLSIEYMRLNICFPVYFCHLQDRIGHPEKVDTEVFITPPGVAQGFCSTTTFKVVAGKERHKLISCLGIKLKLSPPPCFIAY